VKLTCQFRGREREFQDIARDMFEVGEAQNMHLIPGTRLDRLACALSPRRHRGHVVSEYCIIVVNMLLLPMESASM
jgi:hypothetical protein